MQCPTAWRQPWRASLRLAPPASLEVQACCTDSIGCTSVPWLPHKRTRKPERISNAVVLSSSGKEE
eukprot:3034024-Rhodomonas_salina.2